MTGGTMPNTIKIEDLPTLAGKQLEASPWLEITQERVNQFAEATDDFQFIHVDPDKAAQTPFGITEFCDRPTIRRHFQLECSLRWVGL